MLTDAQLAKIKTVQGKALAVAAGGFAVALLFGLFSGALFQGLLIGYLLVFGLGISGLALVMLHHLCGGSWSFVAQRIAEACSRTLWFLFALGIPVILGGALVGGKFNLLTIYPWASPDFLARPENEYIAHMSHLKHGFLNFNMFALCYFVYFGLWLTLTFLYNKWSVDLDRTGDPKLISKMKVVAGFGCVIYVVSMTFAATHWAMSTDPTFFSTIYGAWMIASGALSMMCFCVIMLNFLSGEGPLSHKISSQIYHHFGNFMLGFTIFWSYLSFAPFLIIWNGNLPEEIRWYIDRSDGGGPLTAITVVLIACVWFGPMFALLMRKNKTNPIKLRRIAIYILCTRVLDMYWSVAPSFENNHGHLNFITVICALASIAGIGGLWLWVFFNELKKRSILPQQDPREELMFLKDKAHSHA